MNYSNRVYIDSNILIGSYAVDIENIIDKAEKSRRKKDSQCLNYLYHLVDKRLYVSSLSIMHLVVVMQNKKEFKPKIIPILNEIFSKCVIVNVAGDDIARSLSINKKDMEDNLQYVLSQKVKCHYFITNNEKDYAGFYTITIKNSETVYSLGKK